MLFVNQELNNDYSVQKSCLHKDCKRHQSHTKISYYAVVDASTGGSHFLTISLEPPGLNDVGYGEREFLRQLSAIVCYCVSSDHAHWNSMELFIPIVNAVRHNPSIEKYFHKMAARSYMAQIPLCRSYNSRTPPADRLNIYMILYQVNCC